MVQPILSSGQTHLHLTTYHICHSHFLQRPLLLNTQPSLRELTASGVYHVELRTTEGTSPTSLLERSLWGFLSADALPRWPLSVPSPRALRAKCTRIDSHGRQGRNGSPCRQGQLLEVLALPLVPGGGSAARAPACSLPRSPGGLILPSAASKCGSWLPYWRII